MRTRLASELAEQLTALGRAPDADGVRMPPLLVVPLARGWAVARVLDVTDAEYFAEREQAETRALELARPDGADVAVCDGRCRAEQVHKADR